MRSDLVDRVALLGVAMLIGAVVIANGTPPASQYELSIYDAYPIYFWVLVVGATLVGSLVILASATPPINRSWMFGLILVFMTDVLVLLLPYLRGYRMYGRADAMTHLGYIQDLIAFGGIGNNVYPPVHILALTVSEATGAGFMATVMLMPVLLSAVYFGALFYLMDQLFSSRERILFGLPFAMLPVLGQAHAMFRPFDLSLLLVPFVLYLFVKSQRTPSSATRAALVVALVSLLVYHPLTASFLIAMFFLYFVVLYAPKIRIQYGTPTNVLSLSAAVTAAWYANYAGIIRRFETIYNQLFGFQEGEAPIQAYTEAAEASPALIDVVRVMSFKYGVEFVLFGLGFAFFLVVSYLSIRGRYVPDGYSLMFVGTVGIFSVGGLGFLLSDLIVPHDRPFQIAKIAAVVLAGQLFYLLWEYVDWASYGTNTRTALRASVSLAIVVLVVFSTFGLYTSPLMAGSNHQVTDMEMDGANWLTAYGDDSNGLMTWGMSYRRFYHAQNGVGTPTYDNTSSVPDHFNYTEHEYFGQSLADDRYLIITRQGRIVYPGVFPDYRERWRFTPDDFERLDRDRTVVRVYDNGDYNQYLVHARRGSPTG